LEQAVDLFGTSGITLTLNTVVIVITLVLMFIILIQRGKGGGLVGALGGPGGSSAFGSRAGDQFTKITLTIAAFWLLFIMIQSKVAQSFDRAPSPNAANVVVDPPAAPADPAPAEKQ
jgi:preprotein translocase subunit SecG